MTRTVLVVEDDRSLLDAYRLVLEARGISVLGVGTANEAEGTLREEGADAVVADLGLPDAEGPALVDRLREAAPGTPVLVLTGRDSPALREACRRRGAADYLVKPVRGGELADRLREFL